MESMELPKKQQEKGGAYPAEPKPEKYPYGLRINLDHEALKKLGFKSMPKVGEEVALEALAHVVSAHVSEHIDGKEPNRNVELQITHLGIDTDDEEPSDKLYGGKK